jgi:hemerythrin-like domain-containing protein
MVCDDLYAAAEAAAHDGRWNECADGFRRFRGEMEAHFSTEEQVLFPAFEQATGMTGGPTQMMRYEHTQMRDLMGCMEAAVSCRNLDRFAGEGETLLVLMQQHNMKEQNILYPMCDRSVDSVVDMAGELGRRREGACPA